MGKLDLVGWLKCPLCAKVIQLTRQDVNNKKKYCSRRCCSLVRESKLHANKRSHNECKWCKKEFVVSGYNKHRLYCSYPCSVAGRFGDPDEKREIYKNRLSETVTDERKMKYIKNKSKEMGRVLGIDWEDIQQSYFLALAEGAFPKIQQVAFALAKDHYKQGMVHISRVPTGFYANESSLGERVYEKRELSGIEFADYLFDLKSTLSDYELKLVILALKGLGKHEIFEAVKRSSSQEEFRETWLKTGLKEILGRAS